MARKIKLDLSWAISQFAWHLFHKSRKTDLRIPVLTYHRVLPELIEDENNPLYTVLPEQFEAHLAFLAQEGFQSLSLKEFGEMAQGLRPPIPRAVVITFDDGYADNYVFAWPLAQKYGIKLNLFVSTGLVGESRPVVMTNDGYLLHADAAQKTSGFQAHLQKYPHYWRPMSWRELGEMSQAGVDLGLHGHSHRNLSFLGREEVIRDVITGIEAFQKGLGYCPEFFSLPYGGHEINTHEIVAILKKLQFVFIFTTIKGRALLPSKDSVFPRISILQQDTMETLRLKLLGAYDWLGSVEQLLHKIKAFLSRGASKS